MIDRDCRPPVSTRRHHWLRRLVILALSIFAAIILLVLTMAPVTSQAAEPVPSVFLHDIYKHYIGKNPTGVKLDSDADFKRYFTPDLANIIIADIAKANQVGDIPTLDGDPFTDSQDWLIPDVKIVVDDAATEKTVAQVSFTNNGTAETVMVDLVKIDRDWKINDIHWPEDSLRGIFKQ